MDQAELRAAPAVTVGRVLAERWRLVREIGVGGTGTVFEAVDRAGARFAIKVLHPELARQHVARRRFQAESYAANRVGHPNAIAILDDGIDPDGTVFLVMELLEGSSLTELVGEARTLPLSVVARVASGVLDVLATAHDKGVVHRDVKPGNVFIGREGRVKLLDFGVARVSDRLGVSTITKPGTTVGTAEFMAPEQAAGRAEQIDALTDVWAVGATMFQLLTGRMVHEAWSGESAIITAATRPAPPVRSIMPRLPAGIAHVIDRALSFERAQRWPNARAMRHALLLAVPDLIAAGEEPISTETEPDGVRASRRGGFTRSAERSAPPAHPLPARKAAGRVLLLASLVTLLSIGGLVLWYWLKQTALHAQH